MAVLRFPFAVALLCCVTWAVAHQGPDFKAQCDKYLDDLAREGKFSGGALIAKNGRIVYERYLGFADADHKVRIGPKTLFKVFSTTKRFTATAVLMLVDEGKLALSDTLGKWMPDVPEAMKPVRIDQLLSHRTGIPDVTNDLLANYDPDELEMVAKALKGKADLKLQSEPGSKFSYSNFNYVLLDCILTKATGQTYTQFMTTRILEPAGMKDSFFESPYYMRNVAQGYNGEPGKLEPATSYTYVIMGAGGLVSTPRDLLQYDKALSRGMFNSPKLAELAMQPIGGTPYGFGWIIGRDGHPVVGHSGGNNGFGGDYARYYKDGVCIIVEGNLGFADVVGIRRRLAELYFGK